MKNKFLSENDLLFIDQKNSKLTKLRAEFSARIDRAPDQGHVVMNVVNEIEERKRRLCTDSKLLTDIKNQYKYSILNRFEEVLKEERDNPVQVLLDIDLVKLKEKHRELMKVSQFSNSFQPDFIDADQNRIIDLLAVAWSYSEFINEISKINRKSVKAEEMGFLSESKSIGIQLECASDKTERIIETIHHHLSPVAFDISVDMFKSHFQLISTNLKIRWLLSERLLLYMFKQFQKENIISKQSYYPTIANHFVNKNGASFDIDQLPTAFQQMNDETIRGAEIITNLITAIKNLG